MNIKQQLSEILKINILDFSPTMTTRCIISFWKSYSLYIFINIRKNNF